VIDIIKLSFMLTIISVAAALLIAFTNLKTRDRIHEQQQVAQQNALEQVVPSGMSINECNGENPPCPQQYWIAQDGTDTVFIFKIINKGYSGNITYFVGTDRNGSIEGMSILEQSETPGLGSRTQEEISDKYFWNGLFSKKETGKSWFSQQFKGINLNEQINIEKSVGEWHKLGMEEKEKLISDNAVTAITGATISTQAVVNGIQDQARSYLKAIQESNDDQG